MALTWVILFPLGAAFIRLLSGHLSNAFVMHRTLQLFNVILAIVGMSMGMWTSGLNRTVGSPPYFFTFATRCPPPSSGATFHFFFGTLFDQGAWGRCLRVLVSSAWANPCHYSISPNSINTLASSLLACCSSRQLWDTCTTLSSSAQRSAAVGRMRISGSAAP